MEDSDPTATTDDVEDPEMKAIMGFSSFGSGPNTKKRKYNHATPDTSVKATSSNAVPVSARTHEAFTSTATLPVQSKPASRTKDVPKPPFSEDDLKRLSEGVTLENGDVCYFKKSFVDDPWASLSPQTFRK